MCAVESHLLCILDIILIRTGKMKKEENSDELLLQDIYSSSKMGIESIAKLLGKVSNQDFKNMLTNQMNSYQNFATTATQKLTQMNVAPKEASLMQKLPADMGIAMETAINKSDSKVAELMINGSVMGITDIKKAINSNPQVPQETSKLAQDFVTFHEQNIVDLRQFL